MQGGAFWAPNFQPQPFNPMKRLFILASLFFLIGAAIGQGIEILNNLSEPITNTTLTISAPADSPGILSGSFKIKNNSAAAMNIIVKRTRLAVVPGSENYFCWGECWPATVDISESVPVNPGATMGGFTADLITHNTHGLTVNLFSIYDENAPQDSVNLTVSFDITEVSGFNELPRFPLSGFQPNPANTYTNFHYVLKPGTSGTVSIHNILGTEVKVIELNPANPDVRVFTGDLFPGNYFYRVEVNNNLVKTGKLLISR